MIFRFLILFFLTTIQLKADPLLFLPETEVRYERPKSITTSEWNGLQTYLLPENHPIKKKLDKIFSGKKRVLANSSSLVQAGFTNGRPEPRSSTIVTRHKSLKGYIFKLYTDDQSYHHGLREYELFRRRICGVNIINSYIMQNGLEETFKTPKKWLYPLPDKPEPKHNKRRRKDFILVEEAMDLLPSKQNLTHWRDRHYVTTDLLRKLYNVITDCQFHDGLRPDNLPFCKDGRIAFIDTQKVQYGPVRYYQLTRYLPNEQQKFWLDLTK